MQFHDASHAYAQQIKLRRPVVAYLYRHYNYSNTLKTMIWDDKGERRSNPTLITSMPARCYAVFLILSQLKSCDCQQCYILYPSVGVQQLK